MPRTTHRKRKCPLTTDKMVAEYNKNEKFYYRFTIYFALALTTATVILMILCYRKDPEDYKYKFMAVPTFMGTMYTTQVMVHRATTSNKMKRTPPNHALVTAVRYEIETNTHWLIATDMENHKTVEIRIRAYPDNFVGRTVPYIEINGQAYIHRMATATPDTNREMKDNNVNMNIQGA